MVCDFCRSPRGEWRYQAGERDWQACDRCRDAIQRDDRETLLERAMLAPVPRTVPDRYAGKWQDRAKELHEEFWAHARSGPEQLN